MKKDIFIPGKDSAMLFVENNNTNPYRNHALEEWLMDNFPEDCFMLWRNKKAILLGKNQNAHAEINLPYAREQGIHIVRRITGGGTVFTDEGNIMFTFISCDHQKDYTNFQKFTTPILNALRSLGIPARFSGRNDLTIDGKKFSGNAQCRVGNKVLHHGTLMYQADTGELEKALQVREIKLRSKGVASVRGRVTNISTHMREPMEIEAFRSYLFEHVRENTPDSRLYCLTPEEWDEVARKADEKHASHGWVFGKKPQFNVYKEVMLSGGLFELYMNINEGRIAGIQIMGDFFGSGDIRDIEAALIGAIYSRESFREILSGFSLEEYFVNISLQELLDAFIEGRDAGEGKGR